MPSDASLAPPYLTAEGLVKRYGRRLLFEGLGLAVGPGEALAVTGPNGAGKSTLLQVLAGLIPATAGSVRLTLGEEVVPPEERALRTGFAAPYLHVYDELTAEENLAFLADVRRLPDASRRIAEVLERVGLGRRGGDLVKTYSSGMRQRVRFATALLAEPSVLLLDEPGSNLDDEGRALVKDIVRSHTAAGGGVVVATNVDAEASLCDRALHIGHPPP